VHRCAGEELGLAPTAGTVALRDQIRADRLDGVTGPIDTGGGLLIELHQRLDQVQESLSALRQHVARVVNSNHSDAWPDGACDGLVLSWLGNTESGHADEHREFAELTGMVTPASHRSEREADRAARPAVREAGRGPVRTRGHGGRLDDDTRQRMERAFGADLSAERVHTSRDVDEVSDRLQAHATAIDGDVYLRRAGYRPGTRAGDELLAHAVQRAPADQISLKRRKIHLGFVRMKRAKIQFGRIIRRSSGCRFLRRDQSKEPGATSGPRSGGSAG
jgi:hypothetical protein